MPFRTWQNTITGQAAAELTELFGFNIPQRWSIAHLYQAILNGEEHIPQIAHITTLAGYVHYVLTDVNAIGIGEASGMFPIDSLTGHGGLFKTPVVGQKFMAATCNAPVTSMETAGEGGPYGMALLAAYIANKSDGESLEEYLNAHVFADAKGTTLAPEAVDVDGFNAYIAQYKNLLKVERTAVEVI